LLPGPARPQTALASWSGLTLNSNCFLVWLDLEQPCFLVWLDFWQPLLPGLALALVPGLARPYTAFASWSGSTFNSPCFLAWLDLKQPLLPGPARH